MHSPEVTAGNIGLSPEVTGNVGVLGASMVLVDVLLDPGGVTGATPVLVDLSTSLSDPTGILGASMYGPQG